MFNLYHVGYCGMTTRSNNFDDKADARKEVAQYIRRARRLGRKVVTLPEEDGKQQWEIQEPENAVMVPDWAGYLVLRHVTFECRECGCECETKDLARECCSETYDALDND